MALEEYHRKRDFKRTAEPEGAEPMKVAAAKTRARFVIQKHAASRLHYDFRLEIGGTLVSWAVPKGLPLEKGKKHLAVKVEDHPVEYGDFEGTIPKGEYGGGTVMLWDRGYFHVPGGNPGEGVEAGKFHLILEGEKLHGEWALIRLKGEEDQWLVFKAGEDHPALTGNEDDESVKTGRSMAQIAEKAGAVWKAKPAKVAPTEEATKPPPAGGVMPEFIEPMKAKLVDSVKGDGWLYEVKFDGYRALAIKDGSGVRLISRNQKDLSAKYPAVVEALAALKSGPFIVDGEVVALDEKGHTSFQHLQQAQEGKAPLAYYAFDLLWEGTEDLRALPLQERKARLKKLLGQPGDPLRFSESLPGKQEDIIREISAMGLEGIIAKRAASPYQSGERSGAWAKLKFINEQEMVIGGFTPPAGTRQYFGALLLGYYEGGKLRFAGKVGTGFNRVLLKSLHAKLTPLHRDTAPFVDIEEKKRSRWANNLTTAQLKHCHWTEPNLVCQVKFAEWTDDGQLRQAVFLGLREDKKAEDVHRETPQAEGDLDHELNGEEPAETTQVPPKEEPAAPAIATSTEGVLKVGGRKVEVSKLQKVLYPKTGFTKMDVIDYYIRIAPFLLPHLKNRPVTLKRYPDGMEGIFFYEKRAPEHRPDWIKTQAVPRMDEDKGDINYCVLADVPSLVWAANLANLELHTFQHKITALETPTALVFDLDPGPPADIIPCCQVGLWLRGFFDELGMQSFPKTSGSKGLQMVVPLNTPATYDQTKALAHALAQQLEKAHPEAVVSRMEKSLRAGKVMIDWSQNDEHKTTVCAYSLRAKEQPTVSTPVTWDEVESALKKQDAMRLVFTSEAVIKRVEKAGDLLAPVLTLRQKIPKL